MRKVIEGWLPLDAALFAEHEEREIRRELLCRAERRRIEAAQARDAMLWPNGRFRELGGSGHGFENAAREGHGF